MTTILLIANLFICCVFAAYVVVSWRDKEYAASIMFAVFFIVFAMICNTIVTNWV